MKTAAIPKKQKVRPLNVRHLHRLLRRGKKDLTAIWNAGEMLDKHFEREPAARGAVKLVSEKLKMIADGDVPFSVNHLQKCRQFRLVWIKKGEIKKAVKVGLPWRRAIQLTLIKRFAAILEKKSPKRAAQIRRECHGLITSFAGSKKTKEARAWAESVNFLKLKCLSKNSGIKSIQNRLWVDCWKAAKFRLDDATAQIDRMCALLTDDRLKSPAIAARTSVNVALKKLKEIYDPEQSSRKKRAR